MKRFCIRTAVPVCAAAASFLLFAHLPRSGPAAAACALVGLLCVCLPLHPVFRPQQSGLAGPGALGLLSALCLLRLPALPVLHIAGWLVFFFGMYRLFAAVTDAACTDALTGLSNRTRWDLQAARSGSEDAVVMLDLNGLKQINDTHGHEAGDRILVQFAALLRQHFPAKSLICRWGGDEFAVLLPHADQQTVDRCLAALQADAEENGIFFAAGCALSREHPDLSRSRLLEEADRRMYRSKQQCREGA